MPELTQRTCPHCKGAIDGTFTTINNVPHHITCANERWREWFGIDLVPQRATT